MKCCAECFGDRGLTKNILPPLVVEQGRCDFCRTQGAQLIEPSSLREYFSAIANIYEPADGGKILADWLRQDWRLFDHELMDSVRASSLLSVVLDDAQIVQRQLIPSIQYESESLGKWEVLRDELLHTNRFFPEAAIDYDRLGELLSYLIADEVPNTWYRARIQMGDAAFALAEMGAPPKRVASHGRANPPGIPYLYLGSTEHTAASEIRPHTGELASVAEFQLPDGLKLVDLREPRKLVSPFELAGEDEIGGMRMDIGFLERLGGELTRPVLPQGAAIDYVPSQYLCEFIKKCGYEGVLYSSSVSDGINLALFDPTKAVAQSVKTARVTRVEVGIEDV